MSFEIQKWKAEAHENAAKTVANMLQVRSLLRCTTLVQAPKNNIQLIEIYQNMLPHNCMGVEFNLGKTCNVPCARIIERDSSE